MKKRLEDRIAYDLSEEMFLDLSNEFYDIYFADPEELEMKEDEDQYDLMLRKLERLKDKYKGISISLLDFTLFVGFGSNKELIEFVLTLSEKAQKVFEYLRATIENNHLHNVVKNPKSLGITLALLERDHSWSLKPGAVGGTTINAIKIDYGANFDLVASQFSQQMKESSIKLLEDSVKVLPTQAGEPKLIAPKGDQPKKISVEEIREKLQKDLKL